MRAFICTIWFSTPSRRPRKKLNLTGGRPYDNEDEQKGLEAGQQDLFNEELLLEDLPVYVQGLPDMFGGVRVRPEYA